MKLKFGDRTSIILRNRGRLQSLIRFLVCPYCDHDNFTPDFSSYVSYSLYINWKCPNCGDDFATDLGGIIFETNYDGDILKEIDRGNS